MTAPTANIDLGDVIRSQFLVYTLPVDDGGVLANAGSVTLTVTLPDGTTSSPSVTNSATGTYTASYTPSTRGRHIFSWAATGTNACAAVTVYNVQDPAAALVGLTELQAYLGESRTSQQDAVRAVLEAASSAVENYCNRTFRRTTFTETLDGGKAAVALRHAPVLSVTSVAENGVTTTDYTLDAPSGLLWKGATAPGWAVWYARPRSVAVTYVAGSTSVPEPVVEAVKQTARALWGEQSGGAQKAQDEYAAPADLIPRMARMLLDPYRLPGFGN